MTATPRPWRVSGAIIIDASDHEVATVPQTITRGAQASHDLGRIIVRAVNAHDELVALLQRILDTDALRPDTPETLRERWTPTCRQAAIALLARIKGEA